MSKRLLAACLTLTLVVAASCAKGEPGTLKIPAIDKITFKTPLSKANALKVREELRTMGVKGKSHAFRSGDVAQANLQTLAFITGANFAEVALGYAAEDETMTRDGLAALDELARREQLIGRQGVSYEWAKDVEQIRNGLQDGTLSKAEAYAQFLRVGANFVVAAKKGGDEDFALNTLIGMATYSAGYAMISGKASDAADSLALVEAYMQAKPELFGAEATKGLALAIAAAKNSRSSEETKKAGCSLLEVASLMTQGGGPTR